MGRLFRGVFATVMFSGFASAQFNFQLTLTENGNAVQIPNNATLVFNGPVNQTQTARVSAVYLGNGQVVINQAPQLAGSTAFTVSFPMKLPVTLTNAGTFFFDINFRPTNTTQANSQLTLPFVETITGPAPTFS